MLTNSSGVDCFPCIHIHFLDGKIAFVTNQTISSVMDVKTHSVSATVPVGNRPLTVAFTPN
ncbi:hypothetical protein [Chengkuizengella sediminis]|uniref:hypothetical protein n=1 Tax=Chengkuizengella sediminis TaxID=1885917 RepID=UPI001389FA93|nr:hypothetical protein [Chengkuizengella sediminis]